MPKDVTKKPSVVTKANAAKTIKTKGSLAKMHSRIDTQDAGQGGAGGGGDELDAWLKSKQLLKPEDQLELDDTDLKEDISRVLLTNNNQLPSNLVQYSYKEGAFVPVAPTTQNIILFEYEGTMLHKESEEAKNQMMGIVVLGGPSPPESTKGEGEEEEEGEGEGEDEGEGEGEDEEEGEGKGEVEGEEEEEGEGEGATEEGGDEGEGEGDVEKDESATKVMLGPKKVTNQFNFCERAALTYNNPCRETSTQTIPPARSLFSGLVMQWIIYDAYAEDFAEIQKEKEAKEREKKAAVPGQKVEAKPKEIATTTPAQDLGTRTALALKIIERMINQNTYDDIAKDFRYWEDPADDFHTDEGTLLPLWKFSFEKTKKNNVTALCWSPRYYDLFAVGFGCFDFMKPQPEGALCLFTLKNPSHPEYIAYTNTGVMCIDIHPKYGYLIAIGKYDGSVAVYDVHLSSKEPQYESNSVTNKHAGIVWQVKWAKDLPDGEINFFSVSGDGRVFNWVLTTHELQQTTIIPLQLNTDPVAGPDGTFVSLTGCGTVLTFHPKEDNIFMVGTEEGYMYKCSTAYASMFLTTYEAHHMPVYRIDYNKFCPDIFLSCSADWRIKIWEDQRSEPLFMFDLGCAVGDAEWAPYSSTVFAAVTNDGKIHVFDLNINKYRPVCTQAVVSKRRNKLTRVTFNLKLPILIVGDDRGAITTLKLSPNLRKKVKPPKKGPVHTERELEIMKLEKLLTLVREPTTLTAPPDVAAPTDD